MKKILIILFGIFFLTGCNKEAVDVFDINNEQNNKKVYQVGETIPLNIDRYLNQYDFSRVDFNSSNENVVRINYKENLLTLRAGRSTIKASLYNDNDLLCEVNLGEVIVIDPTDKSFLPINNSTDLSKIKKDGMYYLNKDIEITNNFQIPLFSGILINPNNYKILGFSKNSNNNVSLFNKLSNAYIDGLNFSNVDITGNKEITTVLASEVLNSLITNVHIEGNISDGYLIGGIVGILKNSVIENCSFTGNINNALYLGGIAGYTVHSTINNSYVIGDISSNIENISYIGGFVGLIDGGLIKSSYFAGIVKYKENDNASPIANNENTYYNLINVYYTMDSNISIYDEAYCISPKVSKINDDILKSGNIILGLEDFTFNKGEYPHI